jgi:amino acid transporter
MNRIALYIQVLIFAGPFLFWDDINNVAIKFSLVLFVIIFYGSAFFRLMEGYLKKEIEPHTENRPQNRHIWVGILLQIFMLMMFYLYSRKLLEIVTN